MTDGTNTVVDCSHGGAVSSQYRRALLIELSGCIHHHDVSACLALMRLSPFATPQQAEWPAQRFCRTQPVATGQQLFDVRKKDLLMTINSDIGASIDVRKAIRVVMEPQRSSLCSDVVRQSHRVGKLNRTVCAPEDECTTHRSTSHDRPRLTLFVLTDKP